VRDGFFERLDQATLAGLRRGERAALARVYASYSRACYNLALRLLCDVAAAEDATHDVFLRLPAAARGYRGDAPFGAWLRRLVASTAIDELRRRRRLDAEPDADLAAGPELGGLAEAQVAAWQALAGLSARERAVLVLHAVEGYTHKELGELFGQSESYSKSILSRCIRRLRGDRDGAQGDDDDDDHGAQSSLA
jgi:RNA polymerase sigma-70 factor (ECF subfamily)